MGRSSNNSSADDSVLATTTRRAMLRRIGSAGLLATAGSGLVALARPGGALAQSSLPRVGNSTGSPMSPNCCVICSQAQFHCNGGRRCSGSGTCCYFCDGCGLNGFYCIQSGGCQSAVEVCN
jgi:hypothetical protein